jgi:hypothetical protein
MGIILLWREVLRSGSSWRTGTRISCTAILFSPPIHLSVMSGLVTGHTDFILKLGIMSLVVMMALNSGCIQPGSGTGTLTGNVTIGPLCPVEPCTVSHDRLVAAYEARPITISTTGGSVVSTVIADPDTGYRIVLRPGTYVVEIPHQGIGGSRNLPSTVTIRSGETVRLDISVDTGIR